MTKWKPEDLNEALDDAILSALNDTATEGFCGEMFVPIDDFDDVVEQAIKNILDSEYIKVEFKEEEMIDYKKVDNVIENTIGDSLYYAEDEAEYNDRLKMIVTNITTCIKKLIENEFELIAEGKVKKISTKLYGDDITMDGDLVQNYFWGYAGEDIKIYVQKGKK